MGMGMGWFNCSNLCEPDLVWSILLSGPKSEAVATRRNGQSETSSRRGIRTTVSEMDRLVELDRAGSC